MMQFKYVECPKTSVDDVAHILMHEALPLIKEYWTERGEKIYGKPFGFGAEEGFGRDHIVQIINAWQAGALIFLMAYDNDAPVGILLGSRISPLFYKATVFHIHCCYGRNAEASKGLYNLLESVMPVLSFDEVYYPEQGDYPGNCQEMTSYRRVR